MRRRFVQRADARMGGAKRRFRRARRFLQLSDLSGAVERGLSGGGSAPLDSAGFDSPSDGQIIISAAAPAAEMIRVNFCYNCRDEIRSEHFLARRFFGSIFAFAPRASAPCGALISNSPLLSFTAFFALSVAPRARRGCAQTSGRRRRGKIAPNPNLRRLTAAATDDIRR